MAAAVLVGRGCTPDRTAVPRWYDMTAASVAALPDAVADHAWAVAWTAAEQATAEQGTAAEETTADLDAALAGAVSGVLRVLVPARRAAVDRAVRDACATGSGLARGRAAAAVLLTERRGDGLSARDLDPPHAAPPPAPGVWRPTPPGLLPGGSSGLARARPFAATQDLHAPMAAALGSPRYRADLAEVRRLGEAGSGARTPAQTATASFWAASAVTTWSGAVRPAVAGLDARRAAAVLGPLHRATSDATLAVYRDKYGVPRWRPVTALQDDGDGDPATPRVPGWLPLVDTPPNPEHPSGHCAYAAAAATVLERRLGDVDVSVGGRRWTAWEQLVRENEDARVWGGVHLRGSDEDGTALGRAVAEVVLAQSRPAWDAS